MSLRLVVFGIVALGGSLPVTQVAAADDTLSLERARAIVGVSAPQISPDGTRVAYLRSVGDYKADRMVRTIMLVDAAGGTPRALTQDRSGIGEIRWSPQGDRLAYTASPEAKKPPQLYVMPMNGGDSQKITDSKTGVDEFEWRPDGMALAYAASDEPANKAAIEKHDDAFYVTDEHFLTRSPEQARHVWLVDADGKHAKRLTSGSWSLAAEGGSGLAWMPNGGAIVYQRQPDPIFAHFVKQYTAMLPLGENTDRPLFDTSPEGAAVISSDGAKIAATVPRHGTLYLQNDVMVRSPDGHELATSKAIDRNVHWMAWMPGDTTLAVATSDGVRDVLWMLPMSGAPNKVDLGDTDFAPDATIAKSGAIAFVGRSRTRPDEIFVLPAGSSTPRRLTDENAATAALTPGKSERIDWTTDDGMAASGVLTYPPDYTPGKHYPLILDIHGGPVSTSVWDYSPFDQILAARGYLVFQPNYRGSDNNGDAFLQAIVGHVTSGPGRDNLLGLAAVEKLGIVDTERMGVSGWSGGGLQTSWIVGHTKVFKAAVSGAAVNDWYQQAVLADINEDFGRAFFNGLDPFSKNGRAAYAAESPITYAKDISTPLLILSDTGDQRVPITQSFMMYHALADRGATVKFTAFPRAGHFASDPVGREITFRAWAAWFDRYLK